MGFVMTSWFRYDFGYSWPFTIGHLLVFAVALALTAFAAWRRWRPWLIAIPAIVALWGAAGAVVMHQIVQINEPVRLPTKAFLSSGGSRVLDLGAGSGRAASSWSSASILMRGCGSRFHRRSTGKGTGAIPSGARAGAGCSSVAAST